jgi:ABC-type amino acid transport system permease subunit
VIKFSRVLNVASVVVFIPAIMGVLFGLMNLLLVPVEEGLLGVTVSQIRAFSPNVMDQITFLYQFTGLYLLCTGLSSCIIALIPYRKGEKWAWYTQLIFGGLALVGQFILIYIGAALLPAYYLPLSIALIIIWVVGILLPVKEFFS